MFGQPRCREWTPLATHQLRLRNLMQIVGYNIRPPDNCGTPCSYYYTLHSTTMSAPFYTSEKIQSTHPKWRDIDCESIRRMSCGNVVVRLWRRFCPKSILVSKADQSDPGVSHNDVIVQTWGVYFSGLLHIGANLALDFTPDTFKSNCLVFQMHGGFFCSYDSLRLERVPMAARVHVPSAVEYSLPIRPSSSKRIPNERRIHSDKRVVIESKSHSPHKNVWKNDNLVSRSQSPPNGSLYNRRRQSPTEIFEHSPSDSDVDRHSSGSSKEDIANVETSEKAENLDVQGSPVPKSRYTHMRFLKSEIRPSYNAAKLQKLHLLQYSIKKRKEAVAEIKQRIYQKSSLENSSDRSTMDATKSNKCSLEHDGVCDDVCSRYATIRNSIQVNLFSLMDVEKKCYPGTGDGKSLQKKNGRIEDVYMPNDRKFTLSLNKLLEIKSHTSPMQRLEFTRLTKQLEILRFKRKLLSEERNQKLITIRRLRQTKNTICEENQDLGSELMQGYHSLSKSADRLKRKKQSNSALEKLYGWTAVELEDTRQKLLMQVIDVYDIDCCTSADVNHRATICGIPLAACSDEDSSLIQQQSAIETAAAAGYASMATRSAAILLCKPLRYEIKPLGSRSKIVDPHTPSLVDRDVPLFTRNRDTMLFRYGLFLLNKNIAQLLWSRGLVITDIRPTLSNLNTVLSPVAFTPRTVRLLSKWPGSSIGLANQLLASDSSLLQGHSTTAHSLRSLVALSGENNIHDHARRFNRFKDCVDGQSPSAAMTIRHRHSRSVGSYNDEQALQAMEVTSSMVGSEPSLLLFDLQLGSDGDIKSNAHELPYLSNPETGLKDQPERVTFSVGDISEDGEPILVKMSGNNGDFISGSADGIEEICSKIDEILAKSQTSFELIDSSAKASDELESFSLLEESKSDAEESDNGILHDVIVIPSAEAKLDTGQATCCDSCESQEVSERTDSKENSSPA